VRQRAGSSWAEILAAETPAEEVAACTARSIVIGEGMEAVKAAARRNGSKWYQAWSKFFLKDSFDMEASLSRQSRWITGKMDQGYSIFDIGVDPGKATRSPFYALEKQLIGERGYPTIPLDRPDVC
jgi:hypothetical protein